MKYNDFPSFYPKLMKIIQMAKDAEKDFKRDPDRAIRKAFELKRYEARLARWSRVKPDAEKVVYNTLIEIMRKLREKC